MNFQSKPSAYQKKLKHAMKTSETDINNSNKHLQLHILQSDANNNARLADSLEIDKSILEENERIIASVKKADKSHQISINESLIALKEDDARRRELLSESDEESYQGLSYDLDDNLEEELEENNLDTLLTESWDNLDRGAWQIKSNKSQSKARNDAIIVDELETVNVLLEENNNFALSLERYGRITRDNQMWQEGQEEYKRKQQLIIDDRINKENKAKASAKEQEERLKLSQIIEDRKKNEEKLHLINENLKIKLLQEKRKLAEELLQTVVDDLKKKKKMTMVMMNLVQSSEIA